METIIIIGIILIIVYCMAVANKKTNRDSNKEIDELKKRKQIIEQNKAKVVNVYNIEAPLMIESVKYTEAKEVRKKYKGEKIRNWITDDDIEIIKWSWYSGEMYQYIDNEELKNKINDITLDIDKAGFVRIKIYVYQELLENEKDEILDFLKGQLSDGWGEEDYDFTKEDGTEYIVNFWEYNKDWYIKFVE